MENNFCDSNFEALIQDFKNKKQIVFFLGAGINISTGNHLDWNSLLDSLFQEALTFLFIEKKVDLTAQSYLKELFHSPICEEGKEELKIKTKIPLWGKLHSLVKNEFTNLVKASIIKGILGNNYIASVQDFLYRQCNKNILEKAFCQHYKINDISKEVIPKEYYTLYQIARLILLCPNIRAVVSYNFDNFLSSAIDILRGNQELFFTHEERKIINKRIPLEKFSSDSGENLSEEMFPIYHIHGYIPPPNELILERKNEIVLCMEEFYDNFKKVFSWQTSTQLHFLNNYTCIFAGSSLSDITTQWMIHTAHEQNDSQKIYYLSAANTEARAEQENRIYREAYMNLMEIKNNFHANYGLSPIYEKKGYACLYKKFNVIIKNLLEEKHYEGYHEKHSGT